MSPKNTIKFIVIAMFVALLIINVSTSVNVHYVLAEEPTTQVVDMSDTENVISAGNTDSNTIQDSLKHIDDNLTYMLIIQIILLGAFLGYVAIDRLR